MKISVKIPDVSLWKKLPFKEYLVASFILNVVLIVSIFILKNTLPPVVPLFYGKPSGENQLIPSLLLTIAPIFSLSTTILNMFLAIISKEDFIKKVFVFTSFAVSMLTVITIVKIVFLVGFF